ncbi:uncharacterized protein METZ01_LOCUS344605 [marine metagenome]|uniref:Aspartyl/asparaginy/proline hydroxylase domain-containing protein n=1 Tax=marine metagenome TaxID=408172 RepID=A0A382R578_9ZZZZ
MVKENMNNEKFWSTIEDWPTDLPVGAEFCGNTSLHEKIYKECEKFDDWTHSFDLSKEADEELVYNMTTASGSDMSRWEHVREVQFSKESAQGGYGIAPNDKEWGLFWAVPRKKDFPTVHQFMEENPQYIDPYISKLRPNDVLLSHNHGPDPQFLYNMSINEPEGSKFAIYPTGVITYKPGDIYKLHVNNDHALINGNETRYHLLFKGGRIHHVDAGRIN